VIDQTGSAESPSSQAVEVAAHKGRVDISGRRVTGPDQTVEADRAPSEEEKFTELVAWLARFAVTL
jgi:hypothetical protein